MKKLMMMIVAAAMVCGAQADEVEINGVTWQFTNKDDTAKTVTLGLGGKGNTAIPTSTSLNAANIPWTMTINGETYTVTKVNSHAFNSCTGLTGTLSIPDEVVQLGSSAFQDCTGLTAVDSWGGVTKWGNNTFNGCSNMEGSFPDLTNAESLGERMFCNAPLTGELKLGTSLDEIPRLAFESCRFGGAAVVPANVTTIGGNSAYGTFPGNPNLEAIWVKGKATAASQTYTTAYVYNFAGYCPSLKMVLMGKNTKGGRKSSPLSNCTGVNWFEPANGFWDDLTNSNIGGTKNKVWKYGPGEEFDLEIDDVKMTATFTPTTEAALTNVLSWASSFKTHFGLDTVVSITNSIAVTEGAVTPEMLQNVKLDSPSWFMTFAVKTQAQLNTVLAAVDGPIVADITGAREEITVPAGRQVAILVPGGAMFNYHKRGLIISFL